jgi:alpha-amylase/alpha-mannosidase (GH57 family)
MSAIRRLPVVLCWHMHQPQYRDALTGEYVFPWTYLHAIKDYADMAAHLEADPRARAVVNFTPVLLEQLAELAERTLQCVNSGALAPDPLLRVLTDGPLPQETAARLELLQACLRAQQRHMIERFAPYSELVSVAQTFATPARIGYVSDQFLRDLGTWYHLVWLGESVRAADGRIEALAQGGTHIEATGRRLVLETVAQTLAGIIPRYRRLAQTGQCELAVSPYGHPILPLLLDFCTACEAAPTLRLPHHQHYPGGAERAEWHMNEALRVFTKHFGMRPVGCWPSEGAISTAALALIDRCGFSWAASSASVLRGTLVRHGELAAAGEDLKHFDRPYRVAGQRLLTFFRQDSLSDLIGFTYASWHGDDAAQNLAHELGRLAELYADDPNRCVLIALDGENAWEHYPVNGSFFLRAMYAALAEHPRLELTTLSQVLARGSGAPPLPDVVAGSWVNGTLATWMGDPAKNAAWDLLCDAKEAFDRVFSAGVLGAPERDAALRQLALCESSDWFWWFGDYNPADAVASFDRLYRRQLANLYRLLHLPVPEVLSNPIAVGHGDPEHGGVMRRAHGG